MPNLDWIFASGDFRVFENYSRYDMQVREFASTAELSAAGPIGVCPNAGPSVLLQLCIRSMSDNLRVSQIRRDPKATGGATSREEVTGWGLIQLYLGGLSQRGLVHSHTNHNSEARARKWSDTIGKLGAVEAWDWKAVTSASRRLNARIRRHAVSKVGSRPVLEGAFRLIESHPALPNW